MKGSPVVVCTELEEHRGTSITNVPEVIATLLWNVLGKPESFARIEYYPDRAFFGTKPMIRQQYDLVTLPLPESARDTVEICNPSDAATCWILGGFSFSAVQRIATCPRVACRVKRLNYAPALTSRPATATGYRGGESA